MSTIAKLMFLLTLVPVLEVSILIPLHDLIGGWWTLGLVVCTATLGTMLIKWQGGLALRRIKEAIADGKLPGDEILDGVLILVSSITLITPGVVTDTIGLILLVPSFRAPIRRYVSGRVKRWIEGKSPAGVAYGDLEEDDGPIPPRWQEAPAEEAAHLGRPDDIL